MLSEVFEKMNPMFKGVFVVIFGLNAVLTYNPLKVEIVDEAQTHLMWVSKADWAQSQTAYREYKEIDPKFQVVLADSSTIAVLSA